MMVYGSYYMCKHVQNMTAGRCLKCFQEKDAPSHPSKTMTFKEEAEKILEDLHEKLLIGWIKNDGKTHVIPGHANKDGCINETLTSIINLVDKEVIGVDKEVMIDSRSLLPVGQTSVIHNIENKLKAKQRAKLKGVSNV